MSITTAQELFLDELKDIYSAEKQAIRAYPRITKTASSDELKQALQTHLEQTKGQLERLDRIFELLEKRSGGKTCEAMKGLLEEASESIEEIEKGPVLDVAIIAAAQRIEHYEIAAYGTVAKLAEAMGHSEVHDLLAQTLQEEKDTDQILSGVAESVNSEAIGESQDEEDEETEDEEVNGDDEEGEDDAEEAPAKSKKAVKKAAKSPAKSKSKK